MSMVLACLTVQGTIAAVVRWPLALRSLLSGLSSPLLARTSILALVEPPLDPRPNPLPPQVMEAISSVFEQVRFEPGERIIAAGDPMDYVYLIAQVKACWASVIIPPAMATWYPPRLFRYRSDLQLKITIHGLSLGAEVNVHVGGVHRVKLKSITRWPLHPLLDPDPI